MSSPAPPAYASTAEGEAPPPYAPATHAEGAANHAAADASNTTGEPAHASSSSSSSSSSHCRWSVPLIENAIQAPSPRMGAATVYCANSAWLMGGSSAPTVAADGSGRLVHQLFNDLYRLHILPLNRFRWELIQPSGEIPSPRSGHVMLPLNRHTGAIPIHLPSSAAHSSQSSHSQHLPKQFLQVDPNKVDKILLFGGASNKGATNDLFVLDTRPTVPKWYRVDTSGHAPHPAIHPSYTFLCDSTGGHPRLVVSGGIGEEGQPVRETMILDLHTFTWSRGDVHPAEGAHLARSGASMVPCVDGEHMILYGGLVAPKLGSASSVKPTLSNDTILFWTESQNPALTATLPAVNGAIPAARQLYSSSLIRTDGAIDATGDALTEGGDVPVKKQYMTVGSTCTHSVCSEANTTYSSPTECSEPGASSSSSAHHHHTHNTDGSIDEDTLHKPRPQVIQWNYIIGGCTNLQAEQRYPDVYRQRIDLETQTVHYERVLIEGAQPMPRAAHSACVIPGDQLQANAIHPINVGVFGHCLNRVVVFGGSLSPSVCSNEVLILDVHYAPPQVDQGSTSDEPQATYAIVPQLYASPPPNLPAQSKACCTIM